MTASGKNIALTVDESITYTITIPADVLIEYAEHAGYEPTIEGAQEWVAMGGLSPDDQLITDELDKQPLIVNERNIDPETTIEDADDGEDESERSTLRARFTPEAWIRDYACEVDAEGDQEWNLAVETVANFTTPESVQSHNLDDLRGDPFAPEWIRDWTGPFTIELLCDRHGGEWGDDDTCEDCTTEESTVRPPAPDAGFDADARLVRKANDDTPEVWL